MTKMGIFDRLRAQYHHIVEKKYIKAVKRKQFNLTIDEGVILGVKAIAVVLEVPQYVACEHILQVGSYHLLEDLRDPKRREELKEHLVEVHLLGNELKEDEVVVTGSNPTAAI
ncbi:hypothetical protein ACFLV0_05775 [Chloroflexota bacterium]